MCVREMKKKQDGQPPFFVFPFFFLPLFLTWIVNRVLAAPSEDLIDFRAASSWPAGRVAMAGWLPGGERWDVGCGRGW